jgi:hypothetical protein
MFDSITFSLNKENFDKSQMIKLFENKLNFKSETIYSNSISQHRNYLNWKFWLTENNLNFSGSLTNLILGNNVENAYYTDIRAALLRLEEILETSLRKAKIRKIDISSTIDVDYDVSRYLEILLPPKNFKTITHGNYETLMLVDENVTILKFYDKIKEDNKKGSRKATSYCNNKIRYELHVPRNVSKFFKIPELTFGDLFNEEIYVELVKKWHDNYFLIPTKKRFKPSRLDCTSKTNFINSLAMEAVATIGGIDVLDVTLREPTVDRKVRCEIRKSLKQNFKFEPESSFLKNELDQKVKDCYNQAIDLRVIS